MAKSRIEELRQLLAESGLDGIDDLTLARLARATEGAATPQERFQAIFKALGLPDIDDATAAQMAAAAEGAEDDREFVDAIFVGPCPSCGEEKTRSAEEEPGIEDPTVGLCPKCGWMWCTECGTELSRKNPVCPNPECWLNQEDDGLDDGGEPEPEL